MDDLLHITKDIAICKSNQGEFCYVVAYDGVTIEFYIENVSVDNINDPDRIEIFTSTLKIDGPSRAKGRLYWIIETDDTDRNTWYLDEASILDLSLFDMDETNG